MRAEGAAATIPVRRSPPHPNRSSPTHANPTLDAHRGLCGHGDAHAGHRGRQHGALEHLRRPGHRPHRPAVGRGRLHAGARLRRADGRLARRPARPPQAVHDRPVDLHPRLARLCRGAGHHVPQRHARRAGRRRGDHVRRLARAARERVSRHPRPRRRARRLRGDDRRRVRRRAARRRRADLRPGLALDLPRQPADRHRLHRHHARLRRRVARPRRARDRLARPDHADRRSVPARPRAPARARGRLRQRADPRRAGRRGRADRRLRGDRGARRGADAPAAVLPRPLVHGRPDRRVRHLGVVLRDLPLHDALPAADPRAVGDRGRPLLPAGHDHDAVRQRRDELARREDLRPRHGGRRARARHRRHGPVHARGRRLVVDDHPPRRDGRADRDRVLQPGAHGGRARHGAARAERRRRGRERHVPPGGDRRRRGGARRARARAGRVRRLARRSTSTACTTRCSPARHWPRSARSPRGS